MQERERNKCEVCGKLFNKDGICDDCGLPSRNSFLEALEQLVPKGIKNESKRTYR